jgi:hypothetical protein
MVVASCVPVSATILQDVHEPCLIFNVGMGRCPAFLYFACNRKIKEESVGGGRNPQLGSTRCLCTSATRKRDRARVHH